MPTNYNGTFDILLLADVQCQLLDSFIVHVINYKDYHLINHKSITIMKMELVLSEVWDFADILIVRIVWLSCCDKKRRYHLTRKQFPPSEAPFTMLECEDQKVVVNNPKNSLVKGIKVMAMGKIW